MPPDQAFRLASSAHKADTVLLSWDIASGYYLYRHKFKFVSQTPGIETGTPVLPVGHAKHDEFFGDVEIFRGHVEVEVPLRREDRTLNSLALEVISQGCADVGVCYPPIQKNMSLDLPPGNVDQSAAKLATEKPTPFISEQDRIADSLKGGSVWLTVLSFLGFGLLLAFTPCIFPMIPILSGIVVGQGPGLTTRRAFWLSLSYVLASAVTYTVFGVLAGLFGSNLQAFFQEPWVIMAFSGVFVLLALSMFGVYQFQIPAFIQNKVLAMSSKQRGGKLLGAAVMGMLSALAVGPCITAPLAGALIYIGQTGDAVLGGWALFALGLGMGIPLLIIGTSAGKLLPRAGAWMNVTKAVFGVGLLAVAVWLLARIMPPTVTLVLWVLVLITPVMYLGWNRLWKGVGMVALTYEILLLAGIVTHRPEPVQSLLCNAAIACEEQPSLAFQKISTLDELRQRLAEAHANDHWVMLDFYADWCVSCQEMKHYTFSDPKVQSALSGALLLQADVTKNASSDQALLQKFGLIGPPATLFFGPDQQERKSYRIIVLLLWQLDCAPCLKEFRFLSGTISQHPEFDLVLIATDDLSNKDRVKQVLAQNHLGAVESWIFADPNAQRLRYEIDPSWYGEVPRVYFFDAEHHRTAFSGAVTETQVKAWLKAFKP